MVVKSSNGMVSVAAVWSSVARSCRSKKSTQPLEPSKSAIESRYRIGSQKLGFPGQGSARRIPYVNSSRSLIFSLKHRCWLIMCTASIRFFGEIPG